MKNIFRIFGISYILFSLLFFLTCNEIPSPNNDISINTEGVVPLSQTEAIVVVAITFRENEVISGGVCWSTSEKPTISDKRTFETQNLGWFESNIFGLTANTRYYVRAYAIKRDRTTAYGNQLEFTFIPPDNSPPIFNPNLLYGNVTDMDGYTYKTIKIGTQTWMAENLKTGTSITTITIPKDDGKIERYCNWCDTYGGLYTWDEMMNYSPPDDKIIGTTQGICPTGWHIPTPDEWTTLINYLGGENEAGLKLKETSSIHWGNYSQYTPTNESGFTALPGGYHFYDLYGAAYWYFFDRGESAIFWSSGEFTLRPPEMDNYRFCIIIVGTEVYWEPSTKTTNLPMHYGLSVRCIKD
jgi:uncharacterized protein (TIGR02145 family)